MLTTAEAAHHFALKPATLRRHIRAGNLLATRVNRDYRLSWEVIWSCEQGPMPKGVRRERYKDPLLTKQDLAHGTGFSTRTIERWIADGLPTRNVFGMVRMNQADAGEWLREKVGFELPKINVSRLLS